METKLDLSALAIMIGGQKYTEADRKAEMMVPHLVNGEVFGVAHVLRFGAEPTAASSLVTGYNIKDAIALIHWHNEANGVGPSRGAPWDREFVEELEQIWRIVNGVDTFPSVPTPPRQRDTVAMAVKRLRDQAKMFQKLAITTLSDSDEEAFSKLEAALVKAMAVTGMGASSYIPTVIKEFRAVFGEDFEIAMNRLQEVDQLIGALGGWEEAGENLAKLDKAAEDLVKMRVIAQSTDEDRNAWRTVAINLSSGKAT